jgi:predicted transcriptional regulator
VIMSDRDNFIGGHTTAEVEAALQKEATKSKKSKSMIIHEALRDALKAKGYPIKEDAAAA